MSGRILPRLHFSEHYIAPRRVLERNHFYLKFLVLNPVSVILHIAIIGKRVNKINAEGLCQPQGSPEFPPPHIFIFYDYDINTAEGLFYSRNEDRCTCVFCWEIYDGWKEGCSVKEKHYKKSPDCFKFVMKHKADEFWKGPKKFYRDPYGRDTCGGGFKADKFIDNCKKDRIIIIKIYNNSQKSNVHLDDFENAGIYRHSDVQAYPEYANKNDRLKTFDKWPENVLTHQSPEDLAEAGFLYTGIADFVVCFSCGQMIGIFEKDDIAWIEHAKFSPYCRYLLYKKIPVS
ncbi:E3 ubiquitin-protein ligase XIAP [Armadillidium vulgare]|nr:E3 ubiquitin-protein ligase XIAP [Armadillidium vulgare]